MSTNEVTVSTAFDSRKYCQNYRW